MAWFLPAALWMGSALLASIQVQPGRHFHAACPDLWPHGSGGLEAAVPRRSSSSRAEQRGGKMLKACLGKNRVVTSICSGPDEQLIHIVNILPAIWASSALQERLGDLTSSVTRYEHEGRVDNSPWVLECETTFQPLPLPSPALTPRCLCLHRSVSSVSLRVFPPPSPVFCIPGLR